MKVSDDRIEEIIERLQAEAMGDFEGDNQEVCDALIDLQWHREKIAGIRKWAEAYPVKVFRAMDDRDCAIAHRALVGVGQSLGRVSADNNRWLLDKLLKDIGLT